MPVDERVLQVVMEWVVKAENDLKTAAFILTLGAESPTDTACFHAQQCVEKYLKAMLIFCGTQFPKTHDIERLVGLLPQDVLSSWALEEQRRLTQYATVTRYPGAYEPITLREARRAVRIARSVRKAIRTLLPKKILRERPR
jgi:HEPN domain-containing protein